MLLRGVLLCATFFIISITLAQGLHPHHALADRQGQSGYNAVLDGHPASPGRPQFDLIAGTNFDGAGFIEAAIEYTPAASSFLRNMLLVATLPRYNLGRPEAGFARRVGVAWQQRWRSEQGWWPTISTEVAAFAGPGVSEAIITLIVVKNAGRGVLYGNVFAESADNWKAGPGAVLAYKHPLRSSLHAIGSLIFHADEPDAIELSFEYATDALTVGPGAALTISEKTLEAGVFLSYTR